MSIPAFNPHASGYDPVNALFLAMASDLVYHTDKKTVRNTLRSWKFRRFRMIDVNHSQLLVTGNDDAIVIALRGTERNIDDWLTDGRIILTGGPLGMIHEGFGMAISVVWSRLEEAIQDYQDKGQGIWVTGHSLGAALATLVTAKFIERAKPVRGLYTFGSPRVGDETFARNFDAQFLDRTFRFVNHRDIVTRVPPRLRFGYRHVGQVRYFNEQGVMDDGPNAWATFVDILSGGFSQFMAQIAGRHINAIEDHAIGEYIRKIELQIGSTGI